MATVSISAPGLSNGLLYNNGNNNARVCITSETNEFDNQTIQDWQEEGFDVVYLPLNGGGKEYESQLKTVKEGLGVGENYAVIAFGEAASYCLEYYSKSFNCSRLCGLIAYYPTVIPDTRTSFALSLPVLVHLAGKTIDVLAQPQALGLQGKRRRKTRPIQPGLGTGERMRLAYPAFTYEYAEPGFAEHDMEEYNNLAANIAWTRSVKVLRKGFSRDVDLERRWDDHQEAKFFRSNLSKTLEGYVQSKVPSVTYTSTLSGGIGNQALRRFYGQFFLGKLPPSMHISLVSRTTGADRIVDELYISFEHTNEIPWMLPGVAPTNKNVEIMLVSIVSLRGGRLYSEHVYWDQASVLVQVGLLDPKLAPNNPHGIDRLPVVGRDAARRILHEDTELEQEDYHNRLIRRAHARARKARSSKSSQAPDESGAEGKSEVGFSLPVRNKGKAVQEEKPEPEPEPESQRTATDITDHMDDDDDDGAATETESTAQSKEENGSHKAFVEDGDEGDENGNGQS
ncbi:hypothetical protein N7533_000302 [Penicillium manginii]|uniref:uncharacterized protein n=1 Tax=Penicillium manginii TaxID=203109 RepID=UPI00254945D3|nr:uncharacterized protein N7533_000302 [Penicillium manginii]KAJ5767719.1 hypothetical protein N7533_000302 [Penicillium manginii]